MRTQTGRVYAEKVKALIDEAIDYLDHGTDICRTFDAGDLILDGNRLVIVRLMLEQVRESRHLR